MRSKERDIPRVPMCWRCNGAAPNGNVSALVMLQVADESYSGWFRVPLCFRCACSVREIGDDLRFTPVKRP